MTVKLEEEEAEEVEAPAIKGSNAFMSSSLKGSAEKTRLPSCISTAAAMSSKRKLSFLKPRKKKKCKKDEEQKKDGTFPLGRKKEERKVET